jgi:LacI family transcriptional regulator
MPVTLSDVARHAGVSEATASRVVNGHRYVAAATRTRVEDAVRKLDYLPNRAARDLSTARTATVALLVHHAQYPAHGEGTFSSRVVDGVSRALGAAGYDLLYVPVDDAAIGRIVRVTATRPGRSDGILVLGPTFPRSALVALRDLDRPVVLIDNRLAGTDAVLADNHASSAELARHLVGDHRYRRLVCFAGPAPWPSTAERIAGIRAAARECGASVSVLRAAETTMRDGARLAAAVMDAPPDAVLAVNDAMAIGALHRFRGTAAARVAVTGFDDIAWAQLVDPPLTTVAVDAHAMGAEAARLLLRRMTSDDPSQPAHEVRVPATVRIRASCGCGDPARPLPDVGGGQAE